MSSVATAAGLEGGGGGGKTRAVIITATHTVMMVTVGLCLEEEDVLLALEREK